IDPAGNILEAIRHHSAFFAEPLIDFRRRALFETFDDHVKHRPGVRLDNCRLYRSFSSSFVSAKALTANSKSSRECAAETWVRTRAVPCGTTGKKKPIT